MDGEALRTLVIKFPTHPYYVLGRLAARKGWLLGFPGLLRNLFIGRIKVNGIINLPIGGKNQRWIVLQKTGEYQGGPAFLSSDVGVKGFLEYLRKEKINYVVLKFYEKLPKLHREGGDLDILVADDDEEKIRDFISQHPGTIGIDIFSAFSPGRHGIPYYPPPLARKILKNAIDGPGGSRIPGPKEAFLSFAYHVLYHDGADTGVPSGLPGIEINKYPKNDYAGALARMAKALKINVEITMEGLDEYLSREEWRPMRDTLAIIAERNEWVRKRFFSAKPVKEIGLGVFVLRRSPDGKNLMPLLLSAIEKEKFAVIRKKEFDKSEQENASKYLRGGNWAEKKGLNRNGAFLPVAVVVVMDMHFVYFGKRGEGIGGYSRLRALKEKLRKRFYRAEASLVHSTDNTHEAWDYIEICFPEEVQMIRREVEQIGENIKLPFGEKLGLYLNAFPYIVKRKFFKIRSAFVEYLGKNI